MAQCLSLLQPDLDDAEDPRKTKSPRGEDANGSLPGEGSLDATHSSAVSSGCNNWTLVQPVPTAESTPADEKACLQKAH